MTDVFLIILMAVLFRMCGGGLLADRFKVKFLPELAFSSVVAFHVWPEHGSALAALAWAVTFLAVEAGHGTAMFMGKKPETALSGRKQTLSLVIDPISRAFSAPLGGVFYCWAFMGLKGALIGLSVAPAGLLLAVLWPASYWVGNYLLFDKEDGYGRGDIAELLAGASVGLVLTLY